MNQSTWFSNWHINTRNAVIQKKEYRAVLETVGSDKDHLYLIKCGAISEYNCYGPFDSMPAGILDNMCWLSGWDCNTACSLNVLKHFGVSNPYKDMINHPSVYLVDNNIDLTMRYIHTYYDSDAEAILTNTIGNANIYQIISE